MEREELIKEIKELISRHKDSNERHLELPFPVVLEVITEQMTIETKFVTEKSVLQEQLINNVVYGKPEYVLFEDIMTSSLIKIIETLGKIPIYEEKNTQFVRIGQRALADLDWQETDNHEPNPTVLVRILGVTFTHFYVQQMGRAAKYVPFKAVKPDLSM